MSVSRASEYFTPEFTIRDLAVVARVLELGEAERESLQTLHGGYIQALTERRDHVDALMQDRIEEGQALGDHVIAQPKAADVTRWQAESKALTASFFDDLKALLSREQADRWPLVERELRRFKRIGSGRLHGESIDMIRLVEDVVPEAWSVPGVSDVLSAYAESMDAALKLREDATTPEKYEEMNTRAKTDVAAATAVWEQARTRRVAVRDLNRRTGDQVAALLPPDQAARLVLAILERSFTTLTTPSRSETFIRAAAALRTLSPEQRADVSAVMAPFERSYNAIIQEAAALTLEKEEKRLPASLSPKDAKEANMTVATTAEGETITFMSSQNMRVNPDDPMTDIRRRRFELGRDTRRKLESVLNAQQRAVCTDPPAENIFFYGEDGLWGL